MSTGIGWFTTEQNPWRKPHTHGADDGQIGWRLHAVPVGPDGQPEKRGRALCGLEPRHGWGGDLFIDQECSRCVVAMEKREAKGETFADIPHERSVKSEVAFQAGFRAADKGQGRGDNPYTEQYLADRWLEGWEQGAL